MDALPPLDPRSTALVLIDLQNGIVAGPTAPLSAREVVANARRLTDVCRRAGALVVLVHVTTSPDRLDALRPIADEAPPLGAPLPEGWSDIIPELGPEPGDLVIAKHQWGAFYGTELDLQLRRRGITTIILGGISTNIGVESTARDAYERGYQQIFAVDAMAARNADDHAHTVARIFPRLGRVRTTDQIVRAIVGR
jgi:nicotinamidase-related amidase